MTCKHEQFFVNASVARLEDIGRFSVDIKIHCEQCGKPMRFVGLPIGLDLNGAACSPDGTEGRFAIHPAGDPVPGIPDDLPAGFRVLSRGKNA